MYNDLIDPNDLEKIRVFSDKLVKAIAARTLVTINCLMCGSKLVTSAYEAFYNEKIICPVCGSHINIISNIQQKFNNFSDRVQSYLRELLSQNKLRISAPVYQFFQLEAIQKMIEEYSQQLANDLASPNH